MDFQGRILIVDDQEFQRALLSELVESKGHIAKSISSGIEILAVVNDFAPDVILLDIELPDLSGDKVIQVIRSKYNSSELPVIIISGKHSSVSIVQLLTYGANDYITKPFEYEVAIARIELHLKVTFQQRELIALKEQSVIRNMVTTYNHEINNPLTIAIAGLHQLKKKPQDERRLESIGVALNRITEITAKIRDLLSKDNIESERYAGGTSRLYKLK